MMGPERIDNLRVAGRFAAATHDAQASMRVAGTCMALGEAAGTAASVAIAQKVKVRDVDTFIVRDKLIHGGAILDIPMLGDYSDSGARESAMAP